MKKHYCIYETDDKDIRDGKRAQYNARNYWHNIKIDQLFKKLEKELGQALCVTQNIAALIKEQRDAKLDKVIKLINTTNILNI